MSLRETEIQYLPGVVPKRAEALKAEFGVSTAAGLLRSYPYRYMDRSRLTPISDVRSGAAYVQVRARVKAVWLYDAKGEIAPERIAELKFNTVKRMKVVVEDGSGEMDMTFFM